MIGVSVREWTGAAALWSGKKNRRGRLRNFNIVRTIDPSAAWAGAWEFVSNHEL